MTKQNAIKFLEKMENDPAFRKSMSEAKDPKERKKILHAAHLEFTKHDCEEALKEKYKKPMSDEQLKKIAAAGGKGMPHTFEQYKSYIKTIASQSE